MTEAANRAGAKKPFFRANPILSRVSKITERSETNSATYAGIAVKTAWFLAMAMVGIAVYMILRNSLFAKEEIWQTFTIAKSFKVSISKLEAIVLAGVAVGGLIFQLISVFSTTAVPVTGSIFCATEGYFISFLIFKVLEPSSYAYLGLEALLLTIAVVAVMSWLYTSGKVRMTPKFTMILLTLLLGTMVTGVLTLILSLIPATRAFIASVQNNFAVVIIFDVIAIVIASLFLISDFTMIDSCVKENYPKKYEWKAAFGLAFTVIWLYLKILDLLIQIVGNRNSN